MTVDLLHRTGGKFFPMALCSLLVMGACSSGGGDRGFTEPAPTETAQLTVEVSGAPAGSTPAIAVNGPDGYSAGVVATTVLDELAPGDYTVLAATFTHSDLQYAATSAVQHFSLAAGDARTATVAYASQVTRGELLVALSGLPDGASGDVLVTGPDGFSQALTTTDTLRLLEPGTYRTVAAVVQASGNDYTPYPGVEDAEVVAGGLSAVYVTYAAESAGAVDHSIAGFELVQAVQRAANDVPLIRDRPALLRVYGIADRVDLSRPDIRAEIYVSGELVDTRVLTRSGLSNPQSVDRTTLGSSWNTVLEANLVQPSLSIRVNIDPENSVTESDESNNGYPLGGNPEAVEVQSMAALPLTLVPVLQTTTSLEGRVDAGTIDNFVTMAEALYPFPAVDTQLRATFSSDAPALHANDDNGAWGDVLTEVLFLRNAEAPDRYYYGVVRVGYTSGIAGYGFVSSSRSLGPNTAIGWDYTNSRAGVLAHELGHNLGRSHAPCGGVSSSDPNYPYAGASTGQWGYDPRAGSLMDPASYTDIMGYCNPQWISDYNYENILVFSGGTARALPTSEVPCLVVWGTVRDGAVRLFPSFVVDARPNVPVLRGGLEVIARDSTGDESVRFSFDPPRVGCAEETLQSSFVWFVPIESSSLSGLAEVEVRGGSSTVRQYRRVSGDSYARRVPFAYTDLGGARRHLSWDASTEPMLLVRDRSTREYIAIGRTGELDFVTATDDLEIVLSDGVLATQWSIDTP